MAGMYNLLVGDTYVGKYKEYFTEYKYAFDDAYFVDGSNLSRYSRAVIPPPQNSAKALSSSSG
ncbi:hypothetical protein U2I54_19560 [Bacillus pseudomycoides]|uniref:Uncharacterized protein n=2 Tax=Bacillus TaxID=1386 RepID=A0ABU5K0K0_9BACI|nr:hypothetical protein [Bacillus pseudomycoides]